MIAIKQNIRIIVITILVSPATRTGNAVVGSTTVVFHEELPRKAIQLPTKGTLVLSDIPPIALQTQRSGAHPSLIQLSYFTTQEA